MEKDKHDDKLESYIRKSFEDYEENPRDDMWAGIAGALPPAPPSAGFWSNYRWQLVAASVIVLLVARLLFVQSYYATQLQLAKQQTKPQESSSPDITSGTAFDPANLNAAPEENNQQNNTVQMGDLKTRTTYPGSYRQQGNIFRKASSTETTTTTSTNQDIQQPVADGSGPVSPGLAFEHAAETVQFVADNSTVETSALAALSLLPAPVMEVISLNSQTTVMPLAATPWIKPYKAQSGWYAGFAVTPFWTQDKQPEIQNYGPRPRVTNTQEDPQFVLNLSARVGHSFGRHFALESGMGYQHLTRDAVHHPKFEYRDGHPGGGPGHHGMRSFEYNLDTYSGSASVSLRTEVAGSNTPGDDEPVGAMIESTENMDMLQIPLAAIGRFGNGKFRAMVRAGLVGNIVLNNTLEITAYKLDHPGLNFQNNNGYTVQFDQSTRFIAGYQLAAGVEYFFSSNLSLSLAPTFAGNFPREEGAQGWGHRLPGMTALGVQLGSNWWF